jgi:hypothetical protein
MGSKISKNISTSTVNAFVELMNNVAQTCLVTLGNQQNIDIQAGGNSTVNFSIAELKQLLTLEKSCLQKGLINSNVDQSISQMVDQISTTITQMFQLSLSKQEATNISEAVANIATSVTNSINQTCSVSGSNTQNINIKARENARVDLTIYNNASQYIMSTSACVQDDKIVSTAQQQLEQIIDQSASSQVENTFAGIFGSIFGIFAAIGLIIFIVLIFRRGSTPTDKTVVITAPAPPQAPKPPIKKL